MLLFRVAVEIVKVEPMEALLETWRKKGGRIVSSEVMNRSGNGVDVDEAEQRRAGAGTGVCGGGDWVRGVVVFIVGDSSEADAVEVVVDVVL